MGAALFFKKTIPAVTSVPASALNAVLGRRMAPMNSARRAIYSRRLSSFRSRIPLLVIKAMMPPGLARSRDLMKK